MVNTIVQISHRKGGTKMFWKLCKYELKCSYRNYLALYAVILVIAMLTNPNDGGILSGLATILYGILVVALFIMCFVMIIRNYNDSMFTRNSYLTHTLPVKSYQLLLTKILSAAFWILMSLFVTMLSAVVLGIRVIGFDFDIIVELFRTMGNTLTNIDSLTYLVYMFISTIEGVALIYFVMNVTHTTHIQRFRPLIAIVLYFVISWIVAFLSGLLLSPSGIHANDVASLFLTTMAGYSEAQYSGTWVLVVQSLVLSVAYFFASKYIIDHKLEIE